MKSAFAQLVRLAGKAIGDYRMIESEDRILIGVSGGMDSLLLMLILTELKKKSPVHFELLTATFNPGFEGFDTEATAQFCREHGTEHYTVFLDIPRLLQEKNASEKPCVLCSRLRRGKLSGLAEQLHCGKLALGHHLDDVIVSFLISLTRGGGLTTMGPNVLSDNGKIRVIRPLIYAEKSLIAEAASELALPIRGECIYHGQLEERGDRAWGEHLVCTLAERIPDVRKNILHSLSDVRPLWLLDRKFLNLRAPLKIHFGGLRPLVKVHKT